MKKEQRKKIKKIFLVISISIVLIFLVFLASVTIIYNKYNLDINALTSLNNGVVVYSSSGKNNTLYNTNRSIVEIETLPNYVKYAFIDTEDKRFYEHNGYDIKRIIKALFVDISSGTKSQGASTISQQLVKNALLSNEKTIQRKIKEIVLAIKMEKKFSKDEILEMYLNTIYFGSNSYGIENASYTYFNKPANKLTINEACCLAGLIKSPAYYSPISNYENCVLRRNLVAKLMCDNGHITERELNEVINSNIEIVKDKSFDYSYEQEAIYEACRLLNISERELINNCYTIVTYKDEQIQEKTIEANNSIIDSNEEQYNTLLDGLSIVANSNGHIIAYYANSNYNLHNLKRQPASTLKPLAVYLPCLSHNILSPATQILDEEINYSGYSPQNANKKYHGYVSVRDAVALSLNVPAVKALDYLSIKKSKDFLSSIGININNSDLNLTLALGAVKNGVSMIDLLSAYSIIANMGEYKSLTFVKEIKDRDGKTIYKNEEFSQQLVDAESCFLMTDMLKETAISGTAKRLNELGLPVASKTGTASNGMSNTDLYNISYTSEHSILTWIANIKDNKLPEGMHSSNQPTEVNKTILKTLYENKKPEDFTIPEGIEKMEYDLTELELNHRIVAPTQNLERYIAFDYFKSDNPPEIIKIKNDIYPITDLSKSGFAMSFIAKKNCEYSIYKETHGNKELLQVVKDTNGEVKIIDNNIFNYDNICYSIVDSTNKQLCEDIKIRPKDYLINMLNSEILNNKKKWLV